MCYYIFIEKLSRNEGVFYIMAKIVTLGEIMLRLSTQNHERFIQAKELDARYGGGEANVAISLACYGHDAEFVTKLPDNPLGKAAAAALRKMNVKTDNIAFGGERLGIYFLEPGASVRPSKVVYDRAHSSMSEAKCEDFDFDKIFYGCDWFHFSGITPAISDSAARLTLHALQAAKEKGITVSCDLNFRSKLWTVEKAHSAMLGMMKYVDVFFGNKWDAENILGMSFDNALSTEDVFRKMAESFGFKYIAASHRTSRSASDNSLYAYAYSFEQDCFYTSREYTINPVVDRVGGGDSFSGGFICGLLDKKDFREALEFAMAAAVIKHTVSGDYNITTRDEVTALMGGDGSGIIQR